MNDEALCPYCQRPLEKPPTRKKKCPHCGEYMYVRGGNAYTEKQVKEYDDLRVWLYRLEDNYGISEAKFEDHRTALSKQFGFRASPHDTVWRVLNTIITEVPTYPTEKHRTIKLDKAEFFREEGKDPRPYIESANEVQSGLIKREIERDLNTSGLSPDTKWLSFNTNDDLVCPSCREAEQSALSADEAIEVPLKCTGELGCRCSISADPDSLYFVDDFETSLNNVSEKDEDRPPWWKFWG